MTLTKERIGEISWEALKYRFRKEGIKSLDPNSVMRETGNIKDFFDSTTGISVEEAVELKTKLFREIFGEVTAALDKLN